MQKMQNIEKFKKGQICTNMQTMQNMENMQNLQNMQSMQNIQSCFKKSTPGSVVPFAMFNKTLPQIFEDKI